MHFPAIESCALLFRCETELSFAKFDQRLVVPIWTVIMDRIETGGRSVCAHQTKLQSSPHDINRPVHEDSSLLEKLPISV